MVHITTQAPEIKGCVETLRNGSFVNFFESKVFFFLKEAKLFLRNVVKIKEPFVC